VSAPRISVVMPVYNGTQTIGRALRSVFAQTFRDYEIIVIDDGSTDRLEDAIGIFDERPIRLLRHEVNKGAGAARNTGIRAARGEFIALLDCDDEWLPPFLARQYDALERSPPEVAGSLVDYYLMRDHLGRREVRNLNPGPDWFARIAAGCNVNAGSGLVVRRRVYDLVGYYDEGMARFEDWDWLLRCTAVFRLVNVPEPLSIYHSGPGWSTPATIEASLATIRRRHESNAATHSPATRRILESTLCYERAAALYHARRYLPAFVATVQSILLHPRRELRFYAHIVRRASDGLTALLSGRAARRAPGQRSSAGRAKPVTIVHLITGLDVGGAETMLVKLITRMDRARFENIVVSLKSTGKLGETLAAANVPVLTLNLERLRPYSRNYLSLFRLLRRATILQTWLYHADLLGLVAGSIARTPVILWNLRCSDMDMSRYPLSSRLVLAALVRLSWLPTMVIANSRSGREFHERMGYRPKIWLVIPNGFDIDVFRPNAQARAEVRRALGVSDDALLIGLPARLDPMKDHGNFFAAAGILARTAPEARFVGIGKGVDAGDPALAALIRRNGIEGQVILLGERPDMPRVYNALDIVSLSSAFGEGFPNVLGEAMATGLPCVATEVGDAAYVLGDTGRVVPPHDPHELARAWRELIEIGPDARRALGRAARERVIENFALDAVVREYEELFVKIAEDVRARDDPA
jgi:glycosyltransferase involved in cell wall biosynthesis